MTTRGALRPLRARRATAVAAGVVLWACLVAGCAGPAAEPPIHPADVPPPAPPPDVVLDSTRPGDDTATAPGDVSASEVDTRDTAEPMPLLPEIGHRYALTLQSGERVEGEVIATYDARTWWTPDNDVLVALFDAALFPSTPEDWADDRSIRVVRLSDVVARDLLAPRAPSFAEFARARGLWPPVPMPGVTYVMAGHERHHLTENGFGDFAFDLGRADAGGRWRGDGLDLTDYLSWDQEVVAPRRGLVIERKDDEPDRMIDPNAAGDGGELLALEENLVGLWLTGRYYFYFLHLRQGSIDPTLVSGQWVEPGRPLGRIGNSGTSLEPHLHFVLLFREATWERFFSVPLRFSGVHEATAPAGSTSVGETAPFGGTWISNEPF